MSVFLGIDTSNYTTSAALYDLSSGKMISRKMLLPVEQNQVGLRQSEALFCHTKQLPQIIDAAFSAFYGGGGRRDDIAAVCVSDKPRNVDDSYMPVFLAGMSAAEAIASAMNLPLFHTAHQVGHILAALYSANRLDLINKRFLSFHLSGGTTELLLVSPSEEHIINCEIVAHSLDLKAGQAIDRVGVKMGLHFPAGAQLDLLAQRGTLERKPRISLKDGNCCLSGLQNICENMINNGSPYENVARFAVEFIYETVCKMGRAAIEKYGEMPIVYAGGVMSNSIISERLTERGGIFAKPEFSSDNAAGVAVAASIFYKK